MDVYEINTLLYGSHSLHRLVSSIHYYLQLVLVSTSLLLSSLLLSFLFSQAHILTVSLYDIIIIIIIIMFDQDAFLHIILICFSICIITVHLWKNQKIRINL